jgi:hypothetical protein
MASINNYFLKNQVVGLTLVTIIGLLTISIACAWNHGWNQLMWYMECPHDIESTELLLAY